MTDKPTDIPGNAPAKRPEIPWHWFNWDDRAKPWGSKSISEQNMEVYGNAMFWWGHSGRLDKAARRLWQESYPEVALMLGGMALETLFKSFILACAPRSRWRETCERVTTGGLSRHNLVNLLEATGTRSSKVDRRVLGTLSHYVRWAGRYPTPKKIQDMEDFSDIIGLLPTKTWEGYVAAYDKFNPKLNRPLNRLMRSIFKRMKLPQADG